MTGPEKKFYLALKRNFPTWVWQRIEDSVSSGIPDCLVLARDDGYSWNDKFQWITIELKAQPHTNVQIRSSQIAWHIKAVGGNSWILNMDPKLKSVTGWKFPFMFEPGRKGHAKILSEPNLISPSVLALRKDDFINPNN